MAITVLFAAKLNMRLRIFLTHSRPSQFVTYTSQLVLLYLHIYSHSCKIYTCHTYGPDLLRITILVHQFHSKSQTTGQVPTSHNSCQMYNVNKDRSSVQSQTNCWHSLSPPEEITYHGHLLSQELPINNTAKS